MSQEKKNIVIIGASGHAKVIIDSIEKADLYTIIGLIDSYKDTDNSIFEYCILGTENEIVALSKEYNFSAGIIAIGDNWTRKLIHEKIAQYLPEFEFINAIHPSAILGKNVEIGVGNAIMAGVIVNSDSKVGNFCILNTNSSLDHDGKMGDYSSLAPNTTLGGTVSVGTCTAISLGANVLQDVHIGDFAIIGAGSLINKDVEDFTLVYGVPGKKIRTIQEGEKYLQKNTTKIIEENLKDIAVPAVENVIKHRKINVNDLEIVGYELACFDLKTATDIEIYKENLRNFKGYDAFYKIELFSIKNTETEQLKYFVLKKAGEVLALMPFALRKIIIRDQDTTYYDVSSFYGYSGPLFNDKIIDKDLDCFWYLADSWYQKNKVISEFIRFNLEGNYNHYSGVLYPTLHNVIGDIANDEEEQWTSFPSKVRNNYRKAIANGLEAKIFHKNINESLIAVFYEIYISTMKRNKAETDYFFSLKYFTNLILNNPDNTLLILICRDNIPLSTELILLNQNIMYSFLGGTVAEYFDLRPNDFLKMEAIKWGRKNGYTQYILGGGRANDDSLYKYKKSFFPKHDDLVYYTGRKIINEDMYEKLVTLNLKNTYKIKELDITNDYFPLYRK
jgi:sugar O-acyltransferase (sialic acid O-acetyltransferase NeuD family)